MPTAVPSPLRGRSEYRGLFIALVVVALLPLLDFVLPREFRFAEALSPIFIFAIMGLGLNVLIGYTGLLNLGVAAFMAIGAYLYGILTCDIYPFQLGFWWAIAFVLPAGCIAGVLLGLPALRLRGDYLAIVTLGFGEIVQDLLRNVESITKGSQGINPLPPPSVFGYSFAGATYHPWYYLLLGFIVVLVVLIRNLERSHIGRSWLAVRDDELAASCMGVNAVRSKLLAFAIGASLCSLGGALWASYLGSTGEPGNYDFQISIVVLCLVMVGGMGSIAGVLLGALVMVGFNSIVLVKLTELLTRSGFVSSDFVFTSPGNWKYMVFGLALVLVMRIRPSGLIPASNAYRKLEG